MSIYRLWSILSCEWGVGTQEAGGRGAGSRGEEFFPSAPCPLPPCLFPNAQSLDLRYFLLHYICLIFLKSTKQMHFRYLIRFWY